MKTRIGHIGRIGRIGLAMGLAGTLALPLMAQNTNTATVLLPVRTASRGASARALTVTPKYNPVEIDDDWIWSAPLVYYPTNTVPDWGATNVAVMHLAPNAYTLTLQGVPGSATIYVGTNHIGLTNWAADLTTNVLTFSYVSIAATNLPVVVGGTNVTVTSNVVGGVVFYQVSASSSPSGVSNIVRQVMGEQTNRVGALGVTNGTVTVNGPGIYVKGSTNLGVIGVQIQNTDAPGSLGLGWLDGMAFLNAGTNDIIIGGPGRVLVSDLVITGDDTNGPSAKAMGLTSGGRPTSVGVTASAASNAVLSSLPAKYALGVDTNGGFTVTAVPGGGRGGAPIAWVLGVGVQSVTVGWEAVINEPPTTNYNVYWGVASGVYTNHVAAGTNQVATLSNLVSGVSYFAAVTAVNASGESGYSGEISLYVPPSVAGGTVNSNVVMHMRMQPQMRAMAHKREPMGVYFFYAHPEQSLTNWAKWLGDSDLLSYGYDCLFLNNNWCSTNLDSDGVPIPYTSYLGTPMYPNGMSNTVGLLRSMGVGLQLYCCVNPNGGMTPDGRNPYVWPTNAFACGYKWGQWGVRGLWCDGLWYEGMSGEDLRYVAESLAVGLDEGVINGNWRQPVTIGVSGISHPNDGGGGPSFGSRMTNYYMLGVINQVYHQTQGDLLGGPDQMYRAYRETLYDAQYFVSAQASMCLNGITTTNAYVGYNGITPHSWATTNMVRAQFGLCCLMNSVVAFGADMGMAGLVPEEMAIFKNRRALAIRNDPLDAPVQILFTNSSAWVLSKPMANGDVVVAFWNQATNAGVTVSYQVGKIPGVMTNSAIVMDVFDGGTAQAVTNATDWLSAVVQPGGLNMYRLFTGPVSQLAAQVSSVPAPPQTNLPSGYSPTIWINGDYATASQTNGLPATLIDQTLSYNMTSTNPPTFYTNLAGANGHAGYLFTNGTWAYTASYGGTVSNYTCFIVYRSTVTAEPQYLVEFGYRYDSLLAYTLTTPLFKAAFPTAGGLAEVGGVPRNGWTYAGSVKKGDQLYAWANGRAGTPIPCSIPGYEINVPVYIGFNPADNNFFFTGYIAEMIFYDVDLDFGSITKLQAYLSWKYGF